MEVVPGELSGHVDDLTVLTPPNLLYEGLPRESSEGERGKSISRPAGPSPPSSSFPVFHSRYGRAPYKVGSVQSCPLPPCLQAHVSATYVQPLIVPAFLSLPRSRYDRALSSCPVSFDYSSASISFLYLYSLRQSL